MAWLCTTEPRLQSMQSENTEKERPRLLEMAILMSKLIRILLKLEARERVMLNERPLKYGSWPNVYEVLSHGSGQLCEMG